MTLSVTQAALLMLVLVKMWRFLVLQKHLSTYNISG